MDFFTCFKHLKKANINWNFCIFGTTYKLRRFSYIELHDKVKRNELCCFIFSGWINQPPPPIDYLIEIPRKHCVYATNRLVHSTWNQMENNVRFSHHVEFPMSHFWTIHPVAPNISFDRRNRLPVRWHPQAGASAGKEPSSRCRAWGHFFNSCTIRSGGLQQDLSVFKWCHGKVGSFTRKFLYSASSLSLIIHVTLPWG
jgi:hypothetical protein